MASRPEQYKIKYASGNSEQGCPVSILLADVSFSPSMQQVATLTGHTYRVLYLSASPDGRTIVTGAGDETLRYVDLTFSSTSS